MGRFGGDPLLRGCSRQDSNLRPSDLQKLVDEDGPAVPAAGAAQRVAPGDVVVSPYAFSLAAAREPFLRRRRANAEARLRRHQAAIEAGVDPAAIVDATNQA
jgi:hypothetical protein